VSETPGAGRAPSPADPGLDEAAYATRIEDAFIAERGTPFLVSAKDWALIRGWREAGVPVDTVVRAVRETFEKRRSRAQAGKISSLAYCADAVAERWEMERRGLVGKAAEGVGPGADAPAKEKILASLSARLRALSERLSPGEGAEDSLGRVNGAEAVGDVDAATRAEGDTHPFEEIRKLHVALLAAASKIEALPADLSFEEIEHRLSSIESSLVRAGLKAMSSSSLSLVEDRVSSALGDVSGLSSHVVERMRRALTRREVRALAGFPPLTLLHG
jgi:hypothetical protein